MPYLPQVRGRRRQMSSLPGAGEYGSPGHHPAGLLSPRDGLCQAEKEKKNIFLLFDFLFYWQIYKSSITALLLYCTVTGVHSATCRPSDHKCSKETPSPPVPRSEPIPACQDPTRDGRSKRGRAIYKGRSIFCFLKGRVTNRRHGHSYIRKCLLS